MRKSYMLTLFLFTTFIFSLNIFSTFTFGDAINVTQADGVLVYEETEQAEPRYRVWDENNLFSAEEQALSVGSDGPNDLRFQVVRANHERDEIVLATVDTQLDINVQIFNATGSWGNLLEVTDSNENSGFRGFDVAIEDISGDVLILYENSTDAGNNDVAYYIWNGSSYSNESLLDTGLADDEIRWVSLIPQRGTDQIMALVVGQNSGLYAILWNGTGFDSSTGSVLLTSLTSSTEMHFDFAWESSSQDGFVIYGGGNDPIYRTYTASSGTWGGESTFDIGGQALDTARLCSDPTSDYIGIIAQDSGSDIEVRMWNGSQILSSEPSSDTGTENSGANNANSDCAWVTNGDYALFAFVDTNSLNIDYLNFTKPNTWSTADLTSTDTTANFATNDIKGMRFIEHPTTNEIMVVAQDQNEDVSGIRWTGSNFATIAQSPYETTTDTANANQESAQFDWYRYDPVPNVTSINPSNTNFALDLSISINATVVDNIAVDTVLANITLPNGTIEQLILFDANNDTIFNATFTTTDLTGFYTMRIIANDTSVHQNVNDSELAVFSFGDVFPPNVENLTPLTGTGYDQDTVVNITANVTDNTNVSIVLVNITIPNGTIVQQAMTNETASLYNTSFSNTNAVGSYRVLIIANDTDNNINSTESIIFTIGDATPPQVVNVTPLNGTNFPTSTAVNITANVTDNTNVSSVLARITLPNASVEQITLSNNIGDIYNASFTTTLLQGSYEVVIVANDTNNNSNASETTNFTIGDVIAPIVTLVSPVNTSNQSSENVSLSFNTTDESASTLNCSLLINATLNQTNSTTQNATTTSFVANIPEDGNYTWNVTCEDSNNNVGLSQTRFFTVDTTIPSFNAITTDPSSSDDLDPNVIVTAFGNITDLLSGVDTVILQYKLSNESNFTNISASFNASTLLYNASFNATTNGTYQLRFYANDTLGNTGVSNTVNITVAFEASWSRLPSSFTPVFANLDDNVTIGNLTINNTGDFDIFFSLSSTSNETLFNTSGLNTTNITLSPGEVSIIEVNDTATVSGLKNIVLTINASSNASTPANPDTLNTTSAIVVAPGQPLLVVNFLTPSSDIFTTSQGATTVEFTAEVSNIGTGNATNVSLNISVPLGWILTLGDTPESFSEIESGSSEELTIEVTIPSDFTPGNYTITANATGFNESGTSLDSLGLLFGDSVLVTVNQAPTLLGGTVVAASSTPQVSNPTNSAPAPSSSSTAVTNSRAVSGGIVRRSGDAEIVKVSQELEVLRGEKIETIITLTNFYENTVMEDILVSLEGFMSQYVTITPLFDPSELVGVETKEFILTKEDSLEFVLGKLELHTITLLEVRDNLVRIKLQSDPITFTLKNGESKAFDTNHDGISDIRVMIKDILDDNTASVIVDRLEKSDPHKLYFNQKRNYRLTIDVPTYLTESKYNLSVVTDARLVALNPFVAGFSSKPFKEIRTLIFRVLAVSKQDVTLILDKARGAIEEMSEANFPITRVERLLADAEYAASKKEYVSADELAQEVIDLKESAFFAHDIITKLEQQIKEAESTLLTVPASKNALRLAKQAFAREDFKTALARAKDAQVQFFLEIKGQFNIFFFIRENWLSLLLGSIGIFVVGYIVYRRVMVFVIVQKVTNLDKEEEAMYQLRKRLQSRHFEKNQLSYLEYTSLMQEYHKRLLAIRASRARWKNKHVSLLTTDQALIDVKAEYNEVNILLKQVQAKYLEKGNISRQQFIERSDYYKQRLAFLEEKRLSLEQKLKEERHTFKHYSLIFLTKIGKLLAKLFLSFSHNLKEKNQKITKEKDVVKHSSKTTVQSNASLRKNAFRKNNSSPIDTVQITSWESLKIQKALKEFPKENPKLDLQEKNKEEEKKQDTLKKSPLSRAKTKDDDVGMSSMSKMFMYKKIPKISKNQTRKSRLKQLKKTHYHV